MQYLPAEDKVSISSIRANVVRKSDYKALGSGQLVKTGWMTKWRTRIEGNVADARYRRAAYEATQRNSAAVLSEEYRAHLTGQPVDVSESQVVKNRVYRQDNLRFNPQFSKPEYGLNRRDTWAVRFSRWAHHANGVTELGAAPTGMLLKISKILFTPNRDDKALGSQLRAFAALGAVAALVSQFSAAVFATGGARAVKETAVIFAAELRAIFFSFSAVSAISALCSLTFGTASVLTASRAKLSNALTTLVQAGKDKHIHRIHLLLDDVKGKPGAITLLAKAMRKKIGPEYLADDRSPILLQRLLEAVQSPANAETAKAKIKEIIGSYLTEKAADGSTPGEFLDLETDKGELLKRENHFLVLTNLVEHAAIDAPASPRFKDLRHRIEAGAGHARSATLKGSSSMLNALGFERAGRSAAYLGTDDYIKQRDRDKSN
ncbi:MAG TPA: hypothetical protein VFV28_00715, partial [Limnobacter sp.]|nr:hypothetical protein [Limnobacter sp.]